MQEFKKTQQQAERCLDCQFIIKATFTHADLQLAGPNQQGADRLDISVRRGVVLWETALRDIDRRSEMAATGHERWLKEQRSELRSKAERGGLMKWVCGSRS